ncbi:MAG TPA: flavodoxin domain-containing protein [Streptosporangiaceae bacterium]|jgi:hypothetical protein
MRVLVVYESMFGNTQQIAKAIAKGLASYGQVDIVEVGDASTVEPRNGHDLLVVGGPTHGLGLSRPGTREAAANQAANGVVSRRIGLREWLEVAETPRQVPTATFDTRLDKPRWLVGSAARGVAKRLRRYGGRLVVAPESFLVKGTPGPLRDGEVERARRWGAALGAKRASELQKQPS